MDRVLVTKPYNGLCAMQVCAVRDATDEEILETCNRLNPSGTSLGWCSVLRAGAEERPDTAPVPCASAPEERLHILVEC